MFFNVIAYRKDKKEWLECKIDGRFPSETLTELTKDNDYLKLYEKCLESEYFVYYKFKPIINEKTTT